jgi:hypothetical protein
MVHATPIHAHGQIHVLDFVLFLIGISRIERVVACSRTPLDPTTGDTRDRNEAGSSPLAIPLLQQPGWRASESRQWLVACHYKRHRLVVNGILWVIERMITNRFARAAILGRCSQTWIQAHSWE